jgi:putative FmdB family regulatory protein
MPLYSYECSCGAELDLFREISERDDPVKCDRCEGKMKRKLTAHVTGKESYQFRLYNSKKKTVAVGKGGSKEGRWYRP